MAVLASQDWHLPREHTIDMSTPNSVNSNSIPRQQANDHSGSSTPAAQQQQLQQQQPMQQQQQPYPYPVQQQPQGSWTPSITAQPFYPSYYQNSHQQPYPLGGHPGHTPGAQIPQQAPYFDPAANAQLAQWAYQQMMFNAQQAHQMQMSPIGARNLSSGPNSPNDYFLANQIPNTFSPFPTGTPPIAHNQAPNGGFHPYRRPNRQTSRPQDGDWRAGNGVESFPQPPYGRPEASGSSTSVNSASSQGHGSRQRTISNQSGKSATGRSSSPGSQARSSPTSSTGVRRTGSPQGPQSPVANNVHGRTGSSSSTPSLASSATSSQSRPHQRNASSSSSLVSTGTGRPSVSSVTTSTSSNSSSTLPAARPARPSPLSQGNFTANEKRMSRDDSDINMIREQSTNASVPRSSGLKGRLRRALSINASQTLHEEEDDDESIKASASRKTGKSKAVGLASSDDINDSESTATVQTKKKSRAASLYSRMNVSTDNISLSSTVSSASVMIRKLGSMGKLARRNSLAGITSLFKDKKDKEDAEGKKGKKKKGGKAEASEASVSHATAELDRSSSDWTVGADLNGLSPAAKLARQHTLKSNAEAAARAKAALEASLAQKQQAANGTPVPTWETNTTTRQASEPPIKRMGVAKVNEDGTRVLVEDDDSASEDGSSEAHYGQPGPSTQAGWEEEDWGENDDEDGTIRLGLERTSLQDEGEMDLEEPWAMDIRRSVEKTRKPAKGILKHAGTYDQHSYISETNPAFTNRARSNSDHSHPTGTSELGPLARIPSPDPDHIDGLHRHGSQSSRHSSPKAAAPSLPPFSFDSIGPSVEIDSPVENLAPHPPEKSMFNLPNSSAPALSSMLSPNPPLGLAQRSATAPPKRLVFASNLSVYDTFSSTAYDRRSEPATWSRLTPALAQRIKEELNSYKMEEMEVHAASRIHTQFFV